MTNHKPLALACPEFEPTTFAEILNIKTSLLQMEKSVAMKTLSAPFHQGGVGSHVV